MANNKWAYNEPIMMLNEKVIKNNWDVIKKDNYFPTDKYVTAEKFIEDAKAGKIMIGGAKLIIQNKVPKFVE